MLPPDWQRRMIEMIRGAEPLDGRWFAGGTVLDPVEQIGVYREQFDLRMAEALEGELPGLRALMGDALDPLLAAYVLDHPPHTWTLEHVADALAGWLEARGAERCQVDMARLDAAVMTAWTAADADPLDVSTVTDVTRLRLAPHARLLVLGWSVHRLRSEALRGLPTSPLVEGPFPVAVYRPELEVRHWEPGPLEHALLLAFEPGATVAEAVGAALARHPDAAPGLGAAFHEIASRRLLTP